MARVLYSYDALTYANPYERCEMRPKSTSIDFWIECQAEPGWSPAVLYRRKSTDAGDSVIDHVDYPPIGNLEKDVEELCKLFDVTSNSTKDAVYQLAEVLIPYAR